MKESNIENLTQVIKITFLTAITGGLLIVLTNFLRLAEILN